MLGEVSKVVSVSRRRFGDWYEQGGWMRGRVVVASNETVVVWVVTPNATKAIFSGVSGRGGASGGEGGGVREGGVSGGVSGGGIVRGEGGVSGGGLRGEGEGVSGGGGVRGVSGGGQVPISPISVTCRGPVCEGEDCDSEMRMWCDGGGCECK